jgi:hypothetical protein
VAKVAVYLSQRAGLSACPENLRSLRWLAMLGMLLLILILRCISMVEEAAYPCLVSMPNKALAQGSVF